MISIPFEYDPYVAHVLSRVKNNSRQVPNVRIIHRAGKEGWMSNKNTPEEGIWRCSRKEVKNHALMVTQRADNGFSDEAGRVAHIFGRTVRQKHELKNNTAKGSPNEREAAKSIRSGAVGPTAAYI